MGVLERDWEREDARRRERLPSPHVAVRPGASAPVQGAEIVAWLVFLAGMALLFGPLLVGFGGLALGLVPGDAPMPDWLLRCVFGGIVLGVLGGVPAGIMAKIREER